MRRDVDWSLYLVTDRGLCGDRALVDVVAAAVRGGVTAVQLREKQGSTREFVERARQMQRLLAPQGVPLIINDRVDVALAVGADGVHVGQRDMPAAEARRLIGDDMRLGLSVETEAEALAAETLTADYLGVSPIFPTATKTDTRAPWGLEGLRALRSKSRHKLIAIGGINAGNAAAAIRAGADGIAVVSGICAAADPEAAARTLRLRIEEGRAARVRDPG